MDIGQKAPGRIELFFDKGMVKDQFRLLVGDLGLPPRLDLAPHRLEISLDAIYANRERVNQVEAHGVLCQNGLEYAWYNVSKQRELELFRGKTSDQKRLRHKAKGADF